MDTIDFSNRQWIITEYPAAHEAGRQREPRKFSGDIWEQIAYSIGWYQGHGESPEGTQPPLNPLTVVESKGV